MVAQEPVKAAIWHALNSYCFPDAIFLAERLFAEVPTEEVLHLLATCYHRAGHTKRAYTLLKKNTHSSIHNKYLFASLCLALEKYSEVEVALLGSVCSTTTSKSVTAIISEFGALAGVTLQLLGNVYRKTQQISKAVEHFKQSLKCNPFLWKSFESLLQIGEKVDPLDYFKTSGSFKDPNHHSFLYAFTNPLPEPDLSHLDSLQISSENLDPSKPLLTSTVISKPHSHDLSTNVSRNPNDSDIPSQQISKSNVGKTQRISGNNGPDRSLTPSFGVLPIDSPISDNVGCTPMFITPPVSNTVNCGVKAPIKNPGKKGNIVIGNENTRSYGLSGLSMISPSSNRCTPASENENISMTGLRRSSRLFGSSPREIKRNPKVHFADSKIVSNVRKQKSHGNRSMTQPLTPTMKNNQTTTSELKDSQDLLEKDIKPITSLSPIQQSADGLMHLLQEIGKACQALYSYDSRRAVQLLENLPMHQLKTSWVMEKLAIGYFEMGDMNLAEKAFQNVRQLDPYYIEEGMAIFSSLLWLSRKESLLSSLAQDLVDCEKTSAAAWCAMANCFSLQKEHDLAIKFLKRAIQLDPNFAYAYTLLGHEYVFTEELDLGLSCFRSALRCNERHFNAWYGIGMIYYKQEKYNLAEQHYHFAIKINPKSSVLLCHLAVTQHDLGRPEEALETIHKAIELNPKNGLCKYHKARFLMSLDRVKEALEELEQLKQIVPKDYLVYFLIGKAHQQLDEPHLAQMNFSWAMSLDPHGTNTNIKEAMNQQHYMSDEHDFLDDITDNNSQYLLPGLSAEDDIMSD